MVMILKERKVITQSQQQAKLKDYDYQHIRHVSRYQQANQSAVFRGQEQQTCWHQPNIAALISLYATLSI